MILRIRHVGLVIALACVLWGFFLYSLSKHYSDVTTMTESSSFLNTAFALRGQALITHNAESLRTLYDTSSRTGRYALEHEKSRTSYLKMWEQARNLELVDSDTRLRVTRVKDTGDIRKVNLRQTTFISYRYRNQKSKVPDCFAVDTLHSLTLVKKDERWLIKKEWYLDPLKEDTLIPDVLPDSGTVTGTSNGQTSASRIPEEGKYDRQGAVAYAHKYSGVALKANGEFNYNPKYRSYNGLGGDCTNFVSQVLHEGGRIPLGNGWHTYRRNGSKAWVHTDSFAGYMLSSGKVRMVLKGTFQQAVQPRPDMPRGKVCSLEPGDLIGYQEKGDIVHFAVVVGYDSKGYPLVDSHTADRYKVPWDLGWDRKTLYWLMKVTY